MKNQVCNGWNHEEQLLILLFVLKYLNDLEQVIPFWISFSLLHIKWPDHFKCQVSLLTFPDSRFPLLQYQQWENWSTMFFSKLLERIPGVFGTSHASNYLSAGMRGAAFSHWLTLIMSVPFFYKNDCFNGKFQPLSTCQGVWRRKGRWIGGCY